jgi:hypothetical protein
MAAKASAAATNMSGLGAGIATFVVYAIGWCRGMSAARRVTQGHPAGRRCAQRCVPMGRAVVVCSGACHVFEAAQADSVPRATATAEPPREAKKSVARKASTALVLPERGVMSRVKPGYVTFTILVSTTASVAALQQTLMAAGDEMLQVRASKSGRWRSVRSCRRRWRCGHAGRRKQQRRRCRALRWMRRACSCFARGRSHCRRDGLRPETWSRGCIRSRSWIRARGVVGSGDRGPRPGWGALRATHRRGRAGWFAPRIWARAQPSACRGCWVDPDALSIYPRELGA